MERDMDTNPMKLALYKAAVEGKPEDYSNALRPQNAPAVEDNGLKVMPNGNTVLHVAALHGRQRFVESILQGKDNHKAALSLLFAHNKKNESALHCAAEKGHANIVFALISAIKEYKDVESDVGVKEMGVKEMVRMRDNVMDTALHKAVRMGHLEVMKKLLAEEDDEFEYLPNNAGETPIYMAARLGFSDYLQQLLNTCKNLTYHGPLGRNALHATVLLSIPGCTKLLLEGDRTSLCEMTDDSGWTPLHYAIKMGDNETGRMILERNSSAAYISAGKGDEWSTIFHIAAKHGNIGMMKYISKMFPDCWMMLNSKCQNVFHEAVLSHRLNVINYVLKYSQINNLIDEEDDDGNTPLDMLFICSCNPLKRVAILGLMCKTLFGSRMWAAFSKHFLGRKLVREGGKIDSPGDVTEKPKERKKDGMKEDISLVLETSKANIIVATLISTVTFAGCYTVPGGYDSNPGKTQGTSILSVNFAFQAFVFWDCIAFICSIFSILFHSVMVAESSSTKNFKVIQKYFGLSSDMIVFAAIAAVAAFMFGMSATLARSEYLACGILYVGGASAGGILYVSFTNLRIHDRIFRLFKTS